MTTQITITVLDPRRFDGDPYQVAERAIQQLRGVIDLAEKLVEPTTLMVRNADLHRTLDLGNPLTSVAADWPESPQGRKLAQVNKELADALKALETLQRAAAYNPKAR